MDIFHFIAIHVNSLLQVENHDDFFTTEEGRVHIQDQRGYYILYDSALADFKWVQLALNLQQRENDPEHFLFQCYFWIGNKDGKFLRVFSKNFHSLSKVGTGVVNKHYTGWTKIDDANLFVV